MTAGVRPRMVTPLTGCNSGVTLASSTRPERASSETDMRVRFWGTRGSLARPGPATVRYGGNTSCVEVRTPDGTLIVLDCGTGAYELGLALAGSGQRPVRGHLLITHTHWDHIQGFPFFAPLFSGENEWDIYAPGGLGQQLEAALSGQMQYTYFPVTLAQCGATIRFHDLTEGSFQIGQTRIVAHYLNHPALTLGYRLEANGVALAYVVDHEPHGRDPTGPVAHGAGGASVHREDQRHVAWLAEADLIIHDAQYTIAEYPQRLNWGHTPAEWAVDYAVAADAKRLALFHHDPQRDDAALDRLLDVCRQRAAPSRLDVFAAAEGQILELTGTRVAAPPAASPVAPAALPTDASAGVQTILIADDDPTVVQLLTLTLQSEGFRLLTANDGDTALRMARAERPALILLDWQMPGADGVAVTRALRADTDPGLRDVPIVLLTGQAGAENTAIGFESGVTDYLTKPFKPTHVRTRVRAWLLRQAAAPGRT
jgi:CheY-like chemotaxis protein/phosphoribosyl 1,2-cyclic phosphodiesterase